MNNANLKRVSASEVNREAFRLVRKNFKEMFILNIIPILLRIVGMFFLVRMYQQWLSGLGINLADPQAASQKLTDISQSVINDPSSASKYAMNFTPQTSMIVFAAGLFFFLICVGIGYSVLDKYRNKDYQIRTIADQFQVFSGRYFFSIIFLVILFNLVTEAGFALYLIPGIWFFLMFSQSFYLYKDISANQDRVGILQTFSMFGRSSALMRGFKWSLLGLCIEFVLLEIVNLITREFFSILLHPFEQAALAVFYDKVYDAKKEQFEANAENNN